MKKYTFKKIKNYLPSNFSYIGDVNTISFSKVNTLPLADGSSISWIKSAVVDFENVIKKTQANLIIADKKNRNENLSSFNKCIIFVDNPKLTIARITKALFSDDRVHVIQNSSTIDKDAIIGDNVNIGNNSIIGKCSIGSHSYIDDLCKISDNTIIGDNVIIHAGVKIGSDGFGYAKNTDNEYEKFPHVGSVVIEDNVEIGANTCIDRGTLGNTIIEKGVKIDNLTQISHNVIIGKNSIVCAQVTVAGSVNIAENVWIAPKVSILNGLSIGANSFIGINSTVVNDVPKNEIWAGYPAKKIREK